MSYPIEITGVSGLTIYAVLHHPDGRLWNATTTEWESFNAGNWALYATPLTEQGNSGYYRANFPTEITGVLVTDALYSQGGGTPSLGDAPAIGVGQSQGSAIAAVGDSVVAADHLRANLLLMPQGVAIAGTLTITQMTTDLTDTADNVYIGRLVIWTSGNLIRRAAYVTAYAGATKKLTFGAVPVAPAVDDEFIIV